MIKAVLYGFIACTVASVSFAQGVRIDSTFRPPWPNECLDITIGSIQHAVRISDGGYIMSGSISDPLSDTHYTLARLTQSLELSPLFTYSVALGGLSYPMLLKRADGYNMLVGQKNSASSNIVGVVVFDDDGNIEPTTTDSVANGFVWDCTLGPNDNVFLAGRFLDPATTRSYPCVKLSNGMADSTFARVYVNKGGARSLAVGPNSEVYVVGNFDTVGTYRRTGVARLLPNGEVDSTFSIELESGQYIIYAYVQPGKGLICIGRGPGYADASPFIRRYTFDGILDATFAEYDTANYTPMSIESDGGSGLYVIGGYSNGYVERLDSNGQRDQSFRRLLLGGLCNGIIQDDSGVVAYGDFYNVDGIVHNGVVRCDNTGAIDHQFNLTCNSLGGIQCLVQGTNGTVIAGTQTVSVDTVRYGPTVTFDKQGNLLPTYRQNDLPLRSTGTTYGAVLRQLPSGQLMTYERTTSSSLTDNIYRLNPNGSRDATYMPPQNILDSITHVEFTPDGSAIAVGTFKTVGTRHQSKIVKLLPSGSIDTSFEAGTGLEGKVTGLYLNDNGEIYVSGDLISYNGRPVFPIIKLKNNGAIDESFDGNVVLEPDQNGVTPGASLFASDSQGRIYIAGRFQNVDQRIWSNVVRLTPNGSLDLTFAPNEIAQSRIDILAVDNQDRVITVGTINGKQYQGMTRYLRDGTLDESFVTTFTGAIHSVLLLPNDTMYVAGRFDSVQTVPWRGMVRLVATSTTGVEEYDHSSYQLSLAPNPSHGVTVVDRKGDTSPFTASIINSRGMLLQTLVGNGSQFSIACDVLPSGIYMLNLYSEGTVRCSVFSVIH